MSDSTSNSTHHHTMSNTKKTLTVKPAVNGLLCRHPDTGEKLPEKGGEWPNTVFTRRAIRRGDVIAVAAEKAKAKTATRKPATPKKTSNNKGE